MKRFVGSRSKAGSQKGDELKKYLILIASLLAIGGSILSGQEPAENPDPVVISAGDLQIHRAEFELAVQALPEQYQAYASGPGKRAFAEDLLRMRLLAEKAKSNGLAERPDVMSRVNLAVDNTLASAQIDKMRDDIVISDEQLKTAWEAKKDSLEQAKARHILIAFEGSPAVPSGETPLTEEAAREKAESIRARLLAGEDFATVAEAESHDLGSAARGGDLGAFGRGQMVEEFEKAVFEGEVGAIQPLVRTQFGYHIIQVEERGVQPLDEVREDLTAELTGEKLQAEVDSLSQGLSPVFDESFFGAVPTMPESPHGGSASE